MISLVMGSDNMDGLRLISLLSVSCDGRPGGVRSVCVRAGLCRCHHRCVLVHFQAKQALYPIAADSATGHITAGAWLFRSALRAPTSAQDTREVVHAACPRGRARAHRTPRNALSAHAVELVEVVGQH